MDVIRKNLMDGIKLIAVSTDKFKTSLFSVSFLVPLCEGDATANALLGDVLYRGSQCYPDIEALAAATDELYGVSISPSVRQKGECQCISLIASMIDDRFTMDETPILESTIDLMGEILLHPAIERGVFRSDYVSGEGANLADQIRAQVNDKRGWSIHRLTELMCQGEAYALDKYGTAEEAETMAPEVLWKQYQSLLRTAEVVFYYGGSASLNQIEMAIKKSFCSLLTARSTPQLECEVLAHPKLNETNIQTDQMEVAQGKLALGFRTGGIDIHSPDYPALLVFNSIYGGTASSKLFLNVREKLSLCYFANSLIDKLKGIMIVSSGVEFDKFEVAREEILAQLRYIQSGEVTQEELQIGRQAVASSLRTLLDSQGRLEDFWLTQTVANQEDTPEQLMKRVQAVSCEQVISVAKRMELDTIYYLTGEKAEVG